MLDSSRLDPKPPSDGSTDDEGTDQRRWSQSRFARFALLLLLAALASFLIGHQTQPRGIAYDHGEIARVDVKASLDFLLEDSEATERARRLAESAAPTIYDYDPEALERSLASLEEELKAVRAASPQGERSARRALSSRWGFTVPVEFLRLLREPANRPLIEAGIRSALGPLYERGVVANRNVVLSEKPNKVVVRNLGTREERPLADPSRVEDFDLVKRELETSQGAGPVRDGTRKIAAVLLRPNLTYNGEETAARRAAARNGARPVLYEIRRGEMLVREGDRVTAGQAQKLAVHAKVAGRD
ncbi:MAG: hypothetical protein HY900_02505 [Deltaproteobacteria bacterium]|nr:hypothetical protein [Deltaproteobacteria bacterium]